MRGAALSADAVVAVIGAGAMGAGIAQVAAQSGHAVCLFDSRIGAAEAARGNIAATLESLAAKGKMSIDAAHSAGARIAPVDALADCVGAKLVVEAIVEDLEAKRSLLRELEVIVATDAILATNTSSLSITALAAGLKHPARVVGMHFF
ncbi:MAG TPA: 3-hydroxyacyl-CoA dehydrogenase NAD-binding domain-containing protein, partial [Casimicrobiaceae bacterium]